MIICRCDARGSGQTALAARSRATWGPLLIDDTLNVSVCHARISFLRMDRYIEQISIQEGRSCRRKPGSGEASGAKGGKARSFGCPSGLETSVICAKRRSQGEAARNPGPWRVEPMLTAERNPALCAPALVARIVKLRTSAASAIARAQLCGFIPAQGRSFGAVISHRRNT
jgi:hypothetical protein